MTLGVHFWEAVCFAIFCLTLYKPAKKILVDSLNNYSNSIKKKKSDADQLLAEATKTMMHYKHQHSGFMYKIDAIQFNTKNNIASLKNSARTELDKKLNAKKKNHAYTLYLCKKKEEDRLKEILCNKVSTISKLYISALEQSELQQGELDSVLRDIKNQSIKFH